MTRPAWLLMFVVIWAVPPSVAQNPPNLKEPDGLEGWIDAPSSRVNPALWECAGFGGSWVVSLQDDSVHVSDLSDAQREEISLPQFLKLSKEMTGRRSLLPTADGWLAGFDAGEFGGGLWWFNNEGDDNRKLLAENVHSILQTTNGVFVLVGLAHLSLDSGKIYQFTETAEEVKVTLEVHLDGSPEASTLDAGGRIVIATPKSVLAYYSGDVHELYSSKEGLAYPTSVAVDERGDVYVGMRFFVLRLVRSSGGVYRPQWLMSKKCQSFKIVNRICSCTAPD
jgi:hypothetical protein